ncbi:MAG: thioesterase family protein [Pseudomonas sp.]
MSENNKTLAPESHYELTYRVAGSDSPRTLCSEPGDDFPDVMATARMVGLMELAAARLMRPLLADGELSVGVGVNITHLAATPLFETVRLRATFTGMEGRLYAFTVEAFDDGGKVGAGTHTRAIVTTERLLKSTEKRLQAARAPQA